ncbi:hypothetical protein [Spirosoma arcticum]
MSSRKATITKIVTFILVAYAANVFDFGAKIAPWEHDVSGKAFAEWHKAIDFYMSKRAPVVGLSFMFFQLLFLRLQWKNWRDWPFRCVALALFLQILVTVIAINTNVAMNAGMNAWNPDHLPANWQVVRDEWLGGHERNFFFNTAYSVLVFIGCYFYWTRSGWTKPQPAK